MLLNEKLPYHQTCQSEIDSFKPQAICPYETINQFSEIITMHVYMLGVSGLYADIWGIDVNGLIVLETVKVNDYHNSYYSDEYSYNHR